MDVDVPGIHQSLPTKEKGWEHTALISLQLKENRINKHSRCINSISTEPSQTGTRGLEMKTKEIKEINAQRSGSFQVLKLNSYMPNQIDDIVAGP